MVSYVVGYDRFEGEPAYRRLAELYRALRLYVNVFQPSMKLRQKTRDGSRVRRIYDQAATSLQRLFAADVLTASQRERLETTYQALDPVLLLRQIEILPGTRWRVSLWRHAVIRPVATEPEGVAEPKTDAVRFDVAACGLADGDAPEGEQGRDEQDRSRRKYHRTVTASQPRWWRTRLDPFADVWREVEGWLRTAPERTAKAMFQDLQDRHPGQFTDSHMRTLQRRVKEWRERALVQFDATWLDEDILAGAILPPRLQASISPEQPSEAPQPAAAMTGLPTTTNDRGKMEADPCRTGKGAVS